MVRDALRYVRCGITWNAACKMPALPYNKRLQISSKMSHEAMLKPTRATPCKVTLKPTRAMPHETMQK